MMLLQKINNRIGFTLVELMVVIAIIAILAMIAIPNLIMYLDKDDSDGIEIEDQSEELDEEDPKPEKKSEGSKL